MQSVLGQLVDHGESAAQLLPVRRLGAFHPLRVPQVLAEAKDDKEGGQESDIVHMEAVRVRDLQEALPLRLQV